jgi:branched-chain amino acid transport system substrate-binding protein
VSLKKDWIYWLKVNYEGATGVTFTNVGEAEGSFLEQEIKGGKFKTKKQR